MRDYLLVHVNGVAHRIGGAQAFETVSRFLRYDQRATGTKIVCEEGDCGACTVLVGRVEEGRLRYLPVNSCIQFLFQLDCAHVVTVEGLGSSRDLTPLQDAMVRCHGAQCGYCTPGFVMAMAGLLEVCDRPKAEDVREAITGISADAPATSRSCAPESRRKTSRASMRSIRPSRFSTRFVRWPGNPCSSRISRDR